MKASRIRRLKGRPVDAGVKQVSEGSASTTATYPPEVFEQPSGGQGVPTSAGSVSTKGKPVRDVPIDDVPRE